MICLIVVNIDIKIARWMFINGDVGSHVSYAQKLFRLNVYGKTISIQIVP